MKMSVRHLSNKWNIYNVDGTPFMLKRIMLYIRKYRKNGTVTYHNYKKSSVVQNQ